MATPPLDGNAASGRQRRLWTVTPPLDGNAASGRQRRLWTVTPPLDGNAASVTCLGKLYVSLLTQYTPYVLKAIDMDNNTVLYCILYCSWNKVFVLYCTVLTIVIELLQGEL